MTANTTTADISHFDIIPYADLSPEASWSKLGQGSFGCVFRGEYLSLDVAIKEVLQSTEYDMHKYLQREVKVMQEARHPNIVQYLGLSVAPTSPNSPRRLLIISEYLPRGNLRHYLASKSLPFPWRLRISFAIDLCRGVAYLHARNCLHRDLKGENLLVTENERIKLCDFGFARLAARNDEEMRRMSYCGTDGYMSPEILMGEEFGLEADIFSLGVVLIEILSRTLVDNYHFVRQMPDFSISADEVRSSASPHCPASLITLALSCIHVDPIKRPKIRQILSSLQQIEMQVLEQEARGIGLSPAEMGTWNVGSLGFSGTLKLGSMRRLVGSSVVRGIGNARPSVLRLPSFEGKLSMPSSTRGSLGHSEMTGNEFSSGEESDDDVEALALADVAIDGPGHQRERGGSEGSTGYSTTVIKSPEGIDEDDGAPTLMPFPRPGGRHSRFGSGSSLPSHPSSWIQAGLVPGGAGVKEEPQIPGQDRLFVDAPSHFTVDTITLSSAAATVNLQDLEADEADDVFHSTLMHLPPGIDLAADADPISPTAGAPPAGAPLHRFSLIKPGFQRFFGVASVGLGMGMSGVLGGESRRSSSADGLAKKMGLDMGAASRKRTMSDEGAAAIWGAKCGVCDKKLGFTKPSLSCDDCVFRCHIKCSDDCPPGCPVVVSAPSTVPCSPTRVPQRTASLPVQPLSQTQAQSRPASKLVKKQKPLSAKGKVSVAA